MATAVGGGRGMGDRAELDERDHREDDEDQRGAERPPDLEPRVAADLCSHSAPSGSVADERVHEHPLDRNEDGESDVEHELVERVDLVGVGRASGLGC